MAQDRNLKIPFVVETGAVMPTEDPPCEALVNKNKSTAGVAKSTASSGYGAWSVSEFTSRVDDLLKLGLGSVLVEGEVVGYACVASGHCYFQLKDEEAKLRVVIFRGIAERISFQVEDGLRLIVRGDVKVYRQRGEYQLQAVQVLPQGIGELQLAFEQRKNLLKKEGLFDESLKRDLVWLPRVIGVITSEHGAALYDILTVLARRFPAIPIVVQPCLVQGVEAAAQLTAAVRSLSMRAEELDLDVIIIGRGGGSPEDLWAFNDEGLARAIRACSVPVVSAVGHEVDFTIADFVADKRASTPSAAAEMVSPRQDQLLARVRDLKDQLCHAIAQIIKKQREQLRYLRASTRSPLDILQDQKHRLKFSLRSLQELTETMLADKKICLAKLKTALDSLDPLKVLARGYAIVQNKSGKALLSTDEASKGQSLAVRLHQGSMDVRVEKLSGAKLLAGQAPSNKSSNRSSNRSRNESTNKDG